LEQEHDCLKNGAVSKDLICVDGHPVVVHLSFFIGHKKKNALDRDGEKNLTGWW